MAEVSHLRELEFYLFRYVPNAVSGEFINIGLMMWEPGENLEAFADIRFRQDWNRVLQFDPEADIAFLAAASSEICLLVNNSADRAGAIRKFEHALSNTIQLSEPSPIRCANPAREMERLMRMYLGPGQSAPLFKPNSRAQYIPAMTSAPLPLPLMGMVAAGRPIEAVEVPETISLEDVVGKKDVFVLKVRGDSMQDEHIINGDYVLVEKTKKASNGDITVALVDGYDTTLKRFYLEGDSIRLQPSNEAMPPIIVPAGSVQIQGRVVGVLRKY